MKSTEKNIDKLISILPKIATIASSSAKILKEFSDAIRAVYGKSSQCSTIGAEIADCQNNIDRLFEDFSSYSSEIMKSTAHWSTQFENAKTSIKEREEVRKKFDRYIDKINKLNKIKTDKTKKNTFETKDHDKILKVISK